MYRLDGLAVEAAEWGKVPFCCCAIITSLCTPRWWDATGVLVLVEAEVGGGEVSGKAASLHARGGEY